MLRIPILLILSFAVSACDTNVTRPGAYLFVPLNTLKRLESDGSDLSFMLSKDISCKQKFSKQNHIAMFAWQPVIEGVGKLHPKGLVVYLSGRESKQIMNEIHLCIQLNGIWEAAWKGRYSLDIKNQNFYCTKKNNSSKWECLGCEKCKRKKADIYNLLTKYEERNTPNKSLNRDTQKARAR